MTEASTQVQCRIEQCVHVRVCVNSTEKFKFCFYLYFLEHCQAFQPNPIIIIPPSSSFLTLLTLLHLLHLTLSYLLHLTFPLSLCLLSVLMKKDLRLAVDAAESRKIPLPNGRLALSTYTALCETGLSHKDFSVVYDHLSKLK